METMEDVTFAAITAMRKEIQEVLPQDRRDRLLADLQIVEENVAMTIDYSQLPEHLKAGEQINFIENEYANNQNHPEGDVLYDILQTLIGLEQ